MYNVRRNEDGIACNRKNWCLGMNIAPGICNKIEFNKQTEEELFTLRRNCLPRTNRVSDSPEIMYRPTFLVQASGRAYL